MSRRTGVVATAVVLLASGDAVADSSAFLRFAGGASLPVAGGRWTEAVGVSPTVSAMIGGLRDGIGGGLSVDWTLTRVSPDADVFPLVADNESLHRIRLLAHGLFTLAEQDARAFYVRAGAGVDLAVARYELLNETEPRARMKAGLGLEAAVGVAFAPGPGLRLGAELAVPFSYHSTEDTSLGSTGFNYTSVDLQLLVVATFLSGD